MDQATIFQAGMSNIWSEDNHNLYDDWANANDVVRALGAKVTGYVSIEFPDEDDDNPFVEWKFPDNSTVLVGKKGTRTRI